MLNLKNPFTKNSKRLGDLATWNARRAELEAAAERLKISRSKMIRFAIERLLEVENPPLDQAHQ